MGRIRGNRECFPEVSVCARRTCRYDDAFLVGVRRQPRSSWLSNPVCPPLVDVIGNCQLPCGIGDVVLRSITCPLRFDKHQFPPGFEAITPANDEAAHWWGETCTICACCTLRRGCMAIIGRLLGSGTGNRRFARDSTLRIRNHWARRLGLFYRS